MKYQLNDGRILSKKELKVLLYSDGFCDHRDIEFLFWLDFLIERGKIIEIKE